MSNCSNESGVDSDRSGRKKLREKFARKFKKRKNVMSDFSESNVLVSNARNKLQVVTAMEELVQNITCCCGNFNNMIRNWTDIKSDHVERTQQVVGRNMKLMKFLNDEVDELIKQFTRISLPTSSNNSKDSISDPSVEVANNMNATTVSPSEPSTSGNELLSPRKKARKVIVTPIFSDLEHALDYLCNVVTKSIGPVCKFVIQSKAEDLEKLKNISKQLSFAIDDIRTLLAKANDLSAAVKV